MASNSKLFILLFLVFGLLFGMGDNVKAVCQDGVLEVGEFCDDGPFPSPIACGFAGNRTCDTFCSSYVDASGCFDADPCNQNPTVTITPASTSGAGGEIRNYNLNITNNDSAVAGCVARNFILILTGLPDPTLSASCPGSVFNVVDGLYYPHWEQNLPATSGNIGSGIVLGIPFTVTSCDSYTPVHTENFSITASESGDSGTDIGSYVIDSAFETCDDAGRNDEDGNGFANSDDYDNCYGFSDTCGNTTIEAAEDCEENNDCAGLDVCVTNCTCQNPPASNECPTNYDDCDCNIATGVNGCEMNLLTDVNNCGMCGNVCSWGCENGACMESSGGLVPCGRYANDLSTPWNEMESCKVCHLIILTDNIIGYLLGIVGIITVLSLVIGGMLYVTSSGNSNLVTTAKTAFRNSLYGFVIVFIAWIMTNTTMVLFGFDDPFGDGSWHKFDCEVSTSIPDPTHCGDGIVQSTGNGDGQIEECDFKETKITYLLRNPSKTAEDWVKNIYSCNPADCKLRCQSPPNPATLPDQIGTGCYLSGGCTKGRFVCDIVDQDDPSKDVAVCKDTYNSAEYRIVGFACEEQLDYCCEGLPLPPISEFEIIRGPSGNFKCDNVCKTEGKICIGVGLRNPVTAGCASLVHNLGSTCQNSGNLASNDCRATFRGGSGFCQETLGTPTWSMGWHEAACYCQ